MIQQRCALLLLMLLGVGVASATPRVERPDPFPGRTEVRVGELLAALSAQVDAIAAAPEVRRDYQRFLAEVEAEIEAEAGQEAAERLRQAAPPEQLWLGLERYWRKRR